MRRSKNKIWIALIVALLVVTFDTPGVSAHAVLVRSEPADSAALVEPPKTIRLWFNEPLSAEFSSAEILDIHSQPVEIISIHIDAADPNLMVLALPELAPGLYSIRWKVLSEADGHFTQGPLVFGVGETADFSSIAPIETTSIAPFPEVVLRWMNFALLLSLAGGIAMTYLVLTPATAGLNRNELSMIVQQAAQRRTLLLSIFSGLAALIVGFGLLSWQVVTLLKTLPDTASLHGVAWQVLGFTRWGALWIVRQVLLILLITLIFQLFRNAKFQSSAKTKIFLPLSTIAIVCVTLATQSLSSHAAAITPNVALAVVVDVLHLMAASLWIGGLVALAVGLLPLIQQGHAKFIDLIKAGWRPFSRVAVLSVVILFATGLYSTGQQVASVDALITTLYGQTLLSKIGLMMVVGIIGLLNSVLLHPALARPLARILGRPPGWTPLSIQQFPKLVLLEAAVGVLILLATGLLTASPTANGPEFAVSADEIPSSLTQTVGDMVVTFSTKPNKPGQNVYSIWAASTRRPAPAEVLRVIVRFTFLGEEMGRTSVDAVEIEPGLYQVAGNQLSLAGPWKVQTIVRRAGIEDAVAEFEWMVAPPGRARNSIISNSSLQGSLTVLAAMLILGLCLAIVILAAKNRFSTLPTTKSGFLKPERKKLNETGEKFETEAVLLPVSESGSGELRQSSPAAKF